MKVKEVIVVEGKHDSDTLKKFLDCETIETQGSHLSKATLQLIKEVHQQRGVIVFTDPDFPGEQIRHKISAEIPNVKHAFMMKEKARTTKKVGIEHAKREDILLALENVVTYQEHVNETISKEDMVSLGLNGQAHSAYLREQIGTILFLGKCNAKTLWKRLNMLQINKEGIERIIETL